MGNSDRAIALPLGGDDLPAAVCRRGWAPADSQSLDRKYQRRVAGRDEPHTDRIAWSNGGLQPVAGAAFARTEGIAAGIVCLADLPDSGWAGATELPRVVV